MSNVPFGGPYSGLSWAGAAIETTMVKANAAFKAPTRLNMIPPLTGGRQLLQLILHLGDARLCARFLLRLAPRRAAQADGADRVITDHDRNSTAKRNDIRQTALAGYVAFGGPLCPVGRGLPERQGRIGLAAGEFEIVGRRSIALQKHAQPACAIQNRDR